MEQGRFGEYWRRAFECPFYKTNRLDHVECEAGAISFSTKRGIRAFISYACETNYATCPIYKALIDDYDEKERERLEESEKARRAKYREIAKRG